MKNVKIQKIYQLTFPSEHSGAFYLLLFFKKNIILANIFGIEILAVRSLFNRRIHSGRSKLQALAIMASKDGEYFQSILKIFCNAQKMSKINFNR